MNHNYDGGAMVVGSRAAVIVPPQSYASKLLNGIGGQSNNSSFQQQQQPLSHVESVVEAIAVEAQQRPTDGLCPGKQQQQNGTSHSQRPDERVTGGEQQHQPQECFQPLFYQSAMLNGLYHPHQQQQPPWSVPQNGEFHENTSSVQLPSGNINAVGMNGAMPLPSPQKPQLGVLFHADAGNDIERLPADHQFENGMMELDATLEQMNGHVAGGDRGTDGGQMQQLLSPLHLQLNCDNARATSFRNQLPLAVQNGAYPTLYGQQQQGGGFADTLEDFQSRMGRLTLVSDHRPYDQFTTTDQPQPPPLGIDHVTESVEVPSSEHVAEIVGRMGCKIKALRAKTNTYIKTPVRGEEPLFVVTGRLEDVMEAKREIECAAEHFTQIRASRRHSQGGAPAPGHVTAYVRVPLRVVGLVVGPKGATIKRIQQETHTYIITPSREREPIFEVTGLPQNVEVARREIEHHIYQRTGNMPITTDHSSSSLDFQISATGAMQLPSSDNGPTHRRGMVAACAPYIPAGCTGGAPMNVSGYPGSAHQQSGYPYQQQQLDQRRFIGSGLQTACEMQALRGSGYNGYGALNGYAANIGSGIGGRVQLVQPALQSQPQNTSYFDSFDSLVNGGNQQPQSARAAVFGNALNGGGNIGEGASGIRYGGGAGGLLRSTSGPQQQQQPNVAMHSNDPYRAWSNAADNFDNYTSYYGYEHHKGPADGGALGGELAQELLSAPAKAGGDAGAFLFGELFGSSGSPLAAGFALNGGGGSSSSGISSVGNGGGLSSTNSTSRDEGLGDSPTATTNSSNGGKGGGNPDPYHHLMISSIWSDLDSSVTPRNATTSTIETPQPLATS